MSIRGWRDPWGAVFIAASAVAVAGAVSGRGRLQTVAKPLIAPSLAARVIRRWRRGDVDGLDATLLLIGLGAATVGDVILIEPGDDARLVRGASAFGVAQSSYTALLRKHGAKPSVRRALPRLAAWGVASGLLSSRQPEIAGPLSSYGLSLGTTAMLAADPILAPGSELVLGMPRPSCDRRSWICLGGTVFTMSDGLIVTRRLFLRGETGRRIAEGVILGTYAAAQYLLVEGMLALGSRDDGAQAT